MWTKMPVDEIFDDLFSSALAPGCSPGKLALILDIIRAVLDYSPKFESDEEKLLSELAQSSCHKVS